MRPGQRQYKGHTANVTSVSVSADGRRALSGCDAGIVRLWDVERGSLIKELKGHTGDLMISVFSVVIARNGLTGMAATKDSIIRLWDLETGIGIASPFRGSDPRLAVSPDGRLFASGHSEGKVFVLSKTSRKELVGHDPPSVLGLAFSPDGKRLLTGGLDRTVRLWDVSTGQELHRFDDHQDGVVTVAFFSDGKYAASGALDKTIRIWDLTTRKQIHLFTADTHCTHRLAISPDGRYILSGGGERNWNPDGDYDLHLWRLPAELSAK